LKPSIDAGFFGALQDAADALGQTAGEERRVQQMSVDLSGLLNG